MFLGNLVDPSPKLFLLVDGCSPKRPDDEDKRVIRTAGDLTDLMYMRLVSVLHANGHEVVMLAGRHCGQKCQEYRKIRRHAGKCDRFDGPENEANAVRFQEAMRGEFEHDYISFYSNGMETETASSGTADGPKYLRYSGGRRIIPIFMGQHASSFLEAVQLIEMQHNLPHGYCPHLCTSNQMSNAEKTAGVFSAFEVPLNVEGPKDWWLDISRINKVHEKGIQTLVANSLANSIDSAFKVKLEERTPNGKDYFAMCTACNKKLNHGNWTLHVKTKDHQKSMATATSAAASSSQPSEPAAAISHG